MPTTSEGEETLEDKGTSEEETSEEEEVKVKVEDRIETLQHATIVVVKVIGLMNALPRNPTRLTKPRRLNSRPRIQKGGKNQLMEIGEIDQRAKKSHLHL